MGKKADKYYDTLCNNHNLVKHNLQQLKKIILSNKENIDREATRMLINETLDIVRYCKTQGQRMENRMSKYRRAIEDLGFIRQGGREK